MAEFNLRKYIRSEQAKDSTLLKRLAKIAGHSNTSSIIKWLDKPDRELENFNSFLAIVKELFPNRKYEIIESYAQTICPTKKVARDMLEYAAINKLDKLRNRLIERLIESENRESNEWGKMYLLELQLEGREIEAIDTFNLINEYNVKSLEMKIFTKLIVINCFYKIRTYTFMFNIAKNVKEDICQMRDTFIKNSYKTRLSNVLSVVYLRNNELVKSRIYGNAVLGSTNKLSHLSLANLYIGQSYVFENYELSHDYLKRALVMSLQIHNSTVTLEVERSINFLDCYWGNEANFLDKESNEPLDKLYNVFNLVRSNMGELALSKLNSIDHNNLNDNEKGFYYYLKGLITKNKEDYYVSIRSFNKIGDKFTRNAPITELRKLGENRILLDILST